MEYGNYSKLHEFYRYIGAICILKTKKDFLYAILSLKFWISCIDNQIFEPLNA